MARAPMNYRRRLRSRIIISFLLFGIGLTALFAGITLVMRVWLEEQLIESTLQPKVDKPAATTRFNPPEGRAQRVQTVGGWSFGRNKFAEVPFEWRKFATGGYDIEDTADGDLRAYKF